ncbi:MAG: Asp-tRNA(Asn)/Glu-tRNA(Gln) amidotransferase subunit GatB [Pseudomonadota bacterium]
MNFETVIGLEIHAQLQTKSKIFCSCSTEFGAPPNSHTCPICLGLPGVLPTLNRKVVEFGVKMGLALNCRIALKSVFARKNYFYPDLPKGYQVSMFEEPLCGKGWIDIEVGGQAKRIGLTRIHMEEDAGKLVHDDRKPISYVDLNRAGSPLIEIVSEPDLRSPEEAAAYLKAVRDILVYLEICDGNMEEGSFRCDANVSLRPVGQRELGLRTELKNMNSFRNVTRALEYEIRRQRAVLEDGEAVTQETRLWNEAKGLTEPMRGKEESHDYRYFPEPDLLPVKIEAAWIEEIRAGLPELPAAKRKRFIEQYGLPSGDADVLTGSKALAAYFETATAAGAPAKTAANWILSELLGELNAAGRDISRCPVSPGDLAALIDLIQTGRISGKIAKTVFVEMFQTGRAPGAIVTEKGLEVMNDEGRLVGFVDRVLAENPAQVAEFRAGKEKVVGFFVGKIMKMTKGQADPQTLNALLLEKLKG